MFQEEISLLVCICSPQGVANWKHKVLIEAGEYIFRNKSFIWPPPLFRGNFFVRKFFFVYFGKFSYIFPTNMSLWVKNIEVWRCYGGKYEKNFINFPHVHSLFHPVFLPISLLLFLFSFFLLRFFIFSPLPIFPYFPSPRGGGGYFEKYISPDWSLPA